MTPTSNASKIDLEKNIRNFAALFASRNYGHFQATVIYSFLQPVNFTFRF